MSILPVLPISILLAGALSIWLSRLARFGRYDAIASVAALAALVSMLFIAGQPLPLEMLLSNWQPLSVFATPISLRVEPAGWLIGLVAVLACAAASLAGIAYPGQRRAAPRALALGITAAVVASAYAANLLSLAMSWGLLDMLFAVAIFMRQGGAHANRRATLAVGFNAAATISLWVAALALTEADQSQYWHLTRLPDPARDAILVAAILRLGLYPLSQLLPVESDDAPGRAALLYVLPPLAGFHVLARVATLTTLAETPELTILAVLSLVVGGVLSWLRGESREALPYVALGSAGALVLSTTGTRATLEPQAVLAAGAAGWALSIMTVSLSRSLDPARPWWSMGYVLAAGTLVGVPASAGFAARTSLAAYAVSSPDALVPILIILGETFLFAGLIRLFVTPPSMPAPAERAAIATHAAAIGIAALPTFLLPAVARSIVPGIAPPAFSVVWAELGAFGILLLILPLALAGALEWLRSSGAISLTANLSNFLSLDWLYSLAFRSVDAGLRGIRSLIAVIEGEGAMLWAILILIAAYVVLSGAFL